jgi:hypothetical protein
LIILRGLALVTGSSLPIVSLLLAATPSVIVIIVEIRRGGVHSCMLVALRSGRTTGRGHRRGRGL